MKIKILNIGFDSTISGIQTHSFYDGISLCDYDAVIIDPSQFSKLWFKSEQVEGLADGTYFLNSGHDKGFSQYLTDLLHKRQEETELLLKRNCGIIVCQFRNVKDVLRIARYHNDEKVKTINMYTWLPTLPNKYKRVYNLDLYFKERTGKEIGKINVKHQFSSYFREFKDNIRFESVLDERIRFEDFSNLDPIAMNRAGEWIAFEASFEQGKLIFLPPVSQDIPGNRVVDLIISCIKKIVNEPQLDSYPSWVENYNLPGEDQLLENIKELDNKESEIERERELLEKKINKLKLLKSLLYERGKYVLEPAVREAFKIIGFNVLVDYEEDYDLYAKEDSLLVIGEIEGSENQIDVDKFRQLLDYVVEIEGKGENCKGLLVGNGFLGEEPKSRKQQFTDAAINGCKKQGYCRIATYELFKAVKKVLSNSNNEEIKRKIKKAILNCTNEFIFDQLNL